MTTNPLVVSQKFRSKSSDSSDDKQNKKRTKLKKSQTTINEFEHDMNLPLRRRFSLFRLKRVQQQQTNIHELQQTIEQLRMDLDMKTNELETMKTNQSLEQALKIQTILNTKLEEILEENQTLKQSIEELEEFARQDDKPPNSPASSSVLTTTFADGNNTIIKSTNFPAIRHKNEVEIDVLQSQQQQQRTKKSAPILHPSKRVPTIVFDENTFPSQYQTTKRRLLTQSTSDEKLLRELADCQAIIKQQEQQLINGKKDRDQLCLIVDERANELRNLRQKNEQLEQMIRNEQDEKIQTYENDVQQMRNEIRSLKSQLNEMKKYTQQIEQENHDQHTKMKTFYEQEKLISSLDQALKQSQKQNQLLEDKHSKQIEEFHQHIRQLETKIEEVIKDKALVSLRCGELIEENRRLEKVLIDKVDDYEEKLQIYKEKNSFLTKQIEDMEKQLIETKKQLELVTIEKDETLADMLIAVRVASELRYDAEDRLNKANDDLKRVTEHIEHERVVCTQRRQSKDSNGGHIKIKEIIRTLEANSRNIPINHQRPLSHPCTRVDVQQRQYGTTTDDAKMLTSTTNETPSLINSSHRNDSSIRSITSEQYDEMKSIVEAVCKRMPGSVCKRDALLKWCVERLKNYGISITNFSNSWTDGIAFCALLHSYLPDRIDFEMIKNESKKKRFEIAFTIASSIGIVSILDIDEMCSSEWPDWERVMYYVALIFRHFEGIQCNETLSPILPIPQATSSPISPTLSTSSSSSICASLRTSNSIPTILCSPLQTV